MTERVHPWDKCQMCGEDAAREISATGVRLCTKHAVAWENETGVHTKALWKKRR